MIRLAALLSSGLLALLLPAGANAQSAALSCGGVARQGGLLVCSGPETTDIRVAGEDGTGARTVRTDDNGTVTIGLTRDDPSPLVLTAAQAGVAPISLDIETREDDFRLLKGLDCDKVDARTDAQKKQVEEEWLMKQAAFKTFHEGPAASRGFVRPANGRPTSPFGPTRKYIGTGVNGETCEKISVHRGYDLAVPVGTPIMAPAPGTVLIGQLDMYFEGGAVFLDHGGGLVSVFMHMSRIDVEPGDTVETGQQVGLSGNTGRTTGPHLHWAVKWRNQATEDRDGDFYIDPALLLALDPQ
jgi:murein DD-endopeptidase MepM/ murein hydrolase activator NlpD